MLPTRVSEEGKEPPGHTKFLHRAFPLTIFKFLILFFALAVILCTIGLYKSPEVFRPPEVVTLSIGIPSHEEPNSFKRWIEPPSNLMHSMTDDELFWRASFVSRVKKYPFNRVPKIALMFLTKGPIPLHPLWELFLEGHEKLFSIYIHSLPSYEPNFPSKSVFHGRQIPSQVSEWGKMNMCDAERRLMANALLDISNEWFVLLSESCIPLLNFNIVYDYLMKSRYGFMGVFDDPGPFGKGRYNWQMAPEVDIKDWRKGSQWFAINRKLAVHLVSDTKYYPKFEAFCKPACYVDEHYFPTMLSIEMPQLLANRSITLVDWSRGGSHPATFGAADINEAFLTKLINIEHCSYNDENTSTCFLFARKFAPSTLTPLLELALKVLGYGGNTNSSQPKAQS